MSSSTKEDEAKSENAKKFLFDAHDFSPEALAREKRRKEEHDKKHRFTEQDVEKARKEGFDQGQKAALEQIESALNQSTQKLNTGIQALLAEDQQMQTAAIHTVLLVVRKLLPSLFRQKSMAEIEDVICTALQERPEEPRIVIRVHPEILEPLKSRINELAAANGFNGKIMLLADENINVRSSCKVEWADGGAERLMDVLFSKIESTLLREAGPIPPHLAKAAETRQKPAPEPASDVAQNPAISENSGG